MFGSSGPGTDTPFSNGFVWGNWLPITVSAANTPLKSCKSESLGQVFAAVLSLLIVSMTLRLPDPLHFAARADSAIYMLGKAGDCLRQEDIESSGDFSPPHCVNGFKRLVWFSSDSKSPRTRHWSVYPFGCRRQVWLRKSEARIRQLFPFASGLQGLFTSWHFLCLTDSHSCNFNVNRHSQLESFPQNSAS